MVPDFFQEVATLFLQEAGYYFLFTIPFFMIFWVVGMRFFANRRIQTEPKKELNAGQVGHLNVQEQQVYRPVGHQLSTFQRIAVTARQGQPISFCYESNQALTCQWLIVKYYARHVFLSVRGQERSLLAIH